MATTFAHTHTHQGFQNAASRTAATKTAAKRGSATKFLSDLFEDLGQAPLQAAKFAKHDMFREHINAMSISYFALIVVLIAGSVFLLPGLIPILTQ